MTDHIASCSLRAIRRGQYLWLRGIMPDVKLVPMLITTHGAATFLLPWLGAPLLQWRRLDSCPHVLSVWVSRFAREEDSQWQWAEIHKVVNALDQLLHESPVTPSLWVELGTPVTVGRRGLRRAAMIDIRLRTPLPESVQCMIEVKGEELMCLLAESNRCVSVRGSRLRNVSMGIAAVRHIPPN